jgi:hypothetical protein
MFNPESNLILYISNNQLFKASIDGSNPELIAPDAAASRMVHEGPNLPNVPIISPNGKVLFYYNTKGDFLAINIESRQVVSITPGISGEMFENYPNAFPIGFLNNSDLLYYSLDAKGEYHYGKKSPVFLFNLATMKYHEFDISEGLLANGHASLGGMVISPDGSSFVVHSIITKQGFDFYDYTGKLIYSCVNVDFEYNYYNWGGGTNYSPSLNVWSPDGKFLVSWSLPLQVINPTNCKVNTLSKIPYTLATWQP